jgi:membrane fusion protein, multidrug efflux system
MRTTLSVTLAFGPLLLAGCSRPNAASKATASTPQAPIPAVTAPVESRVLPRILEVTGALAADEAADVAAERDGQIAAVRVERGTYVEKGAVLATLDEREAKAALDQARATLAWTSAEVDRYAELRRKPLRVDRDALAVGDIAHVERHDHRQSQALQAQDQS